MTGSNSMMEEGGGFVNYIPDTVDPGDSMLIGTILFSLLLMLLLPCFVAVGKRFQTHENPHGDVDTASDDDDNTSPLQQQQQATHDNDDNLSIHSNHTHVSSVVSGVVNAILDASPHGGPLRSVKHANQRLHHHDGGEVSVLGRISQDEVSIRDAVDAAHDTNKQAAHRTTTIATSSSSWEKLLLIAEWDYESKRLCKLALPFICQALLKGIMEAVRVAIIGRFIGTNALLAYLAVDLLIGLTTSLLGGFQEALTTLCSQTLGQGNRKLAGQYVQIATILFVLCYIPIFFLWMLSMGPAVTWLGFDDSVRVIAEEFTLFFLFAEFIAGIHDSAHSLLDVIGKENYSTFFNLGAEVANVSGLLLIAMKYPEPGQSLQLVGFAFVGLEALGLVVNTIIIVWNGWFDRFLGGLVGGVALLNIRATRTLIGTATSLAIGEFLAYSEWELMTLFASFLGPAEVAVWGLLGTLWDAVELVTEAVADSAEVRVSFLLGSGQPAKAKLAAYKAIFLAIFAAVIMTSILFIGGEDVSTWLTTDPTLQRMTSDLLPLFGLGNIALTVGTVSWTIVGAQGRYRLATAVGFSGSWFIAVPLAALFSAFFNMDLKGQTAALVLGYMVSGTLNSYVLFQSDWPKLSRRVIVIAAAANAANDDDDDSSSSSSSSDGSQESAATPKSSNKILMEEEEKETSPPPQQQQSSGFLDGISQSFMMLVDSSQTSSLQPPQVQ